MAQLLSAAAQGDSQYVGLSARDTADALRHLTTAVRGVASTHPDAPRDRLVASARDVMEKSVMLLQEVQQCMTQPGHPENQQRLAQVAKAVTSSLNACISCLPGQQDLDGAINEVTIIIESIRSDRLNATNRSYVEIQDDLVRLAGELTEATNRLVGAVGGPPHLLADAINHYLHVLRRFINCGLELAYLTQVS